MSKKSEIMAGLVERFPPEMIGQELREFEADARTFSEKQQALVREYAEQWVAFLNGRVVANDTDFQTVLDQLDAAGLPRRKAVVRFLTETPSILIL